MQAIERAFAVLRAVRAASGNVGVGAVARATGLPKSTVSRLLASLEAVDAVERVGDTGRYAISTGLAALAGGATSISSLRDLVRPVLRDLVEELDESAGLTVEDGGGALYVDHVAPDTAVMTRDWTGMRFPFHTVAGGLATMTTWSDSQIAEYAAPGLDRFTDRTIATFDTLRQRLLGARRSGYVWTLGEFDEEINGVGAPIRDGEGTAIAAVTVYGPGYRFPGNRDPDAVGRLVREAAQRVERLHHRV